MSAEYSVRPARASDAPAITACVADAYKLYIERMGKPPGPMLDNYADIIRDHQVTVVEHQGRVVGALVLIKTDEGLLLDNVAVSPEYQGKGVGKILIEFAEQEARRQGYTSIYLYTNEKMTENLVLYPKISYAEYERRIEKGYSRVYLRKQLI
ncbi:MAG: GNAT family N-acetyltransferase [Deltaproteobacteria bacterium]|nr:GNAT family N-acetyltransferase [Deltaproteobacteria bacterium]